jgi:hypothetical protein
MMDFESVGCYFKNTSKYGQTQKYKNFRREVIPHVRIHGEEQSFQQDL